MYSCHYEVKSIAIKSSKYHISQEEIVKEYEVIKDSIKNPANFQMLYDRYFELIFRFIFRRIDDEEQTADLTSQVFYKSLKNLKKYRFKAVPFSAWLFRIASNEVAAFYRIHQRNRIYSFEEEIIQEIVEENLEEELDLEELKNAMKKLTEGEVEILELRFYEEKPFAEIAFILEISEANAKMRTYRTLEKLRKHLIHKVK